MATKCPKCGKGTLKKGEKMVYCSEYKPKKEGNTWTNEGSCDFRIMYSNKAWGTALTPSDIKKLVSGEALRNRRGDVMTLDLQTSFFTKIEFAPKTEDEDL